MRALGDLLRNSPARFPRLVFFLSTMGFVWVVGSAIAGDSEMSSSATVFFALIGVVAFVYGREEDL